MIFVAAQNYLTTLYDLSYFKAFVSTIRSTWPSCQFKVSVTFDLQIVGKWSSECQLRSDWLQYC